MEEKINIAEILKDKPKGTKLYSSACGKCKLEEVDDKSFKISFYNSKFGFMNGGEGYLDKNGKLYDDGECVVFPSKEMRDWRKFEWKKGDVLVNSSGFKLFFDRWANDDYTRFFGKVNILEDSFIYETEKYTLVSKDETLDNFGIDKPEFNDGDVIKITWDKYSAILIFWEYSNFGKGFDSHVFFNIKTKIIEYNIHGHTFKDAILRLATEEEKKQLFSALEKKGKRWDSDKKAIVDLKPKCEFKPFDRCIWKIRNCEGSIWQASFVSYVDEYGASPIGISIDEDLVNLIILPYNDKTKLLVGTTDDWKGGDQ